MDILKKILLIGLILYASCDGKEQNTNAPIPIFNQAYQENFRKDNIEEIIANASGAYVLLDPFDSDSYQSVAAIKEKGNEVGAYISIGTGETFRSDFDSMKEFLVETAWEDWPNEYYIKETNTGVARVMKERIDKIADWGFDWVEFDNMDWALYDDSKKQYGFNVSREDAVAYYQDLCNYVHQRGMKCMAKNTVVGAEDFDGVLYESYDDSKNWWNEAGAKSFVQAGKLVIINHYNETDCDKAYSDYKKIYGENISFICEDAIQKKYVHFNMN